MRRLSIMNTVALLARVAPEAGKMGARPGGEPPGARVKPTGGKSWCTT
jgi:hypothetical protein